MQVALLGNSHSACVKSAYDAFPEARSGYEFTFFAARGSNLRRMGVLQNALVPQDDELRRSIAFTSNGLTSIAPNDYDAVVIFGVGLKPFVLPKKFYSSAVVRQSYKDTVHACAAFYVAQLIRSISTTPIYAAHQPMVVAPRQMAQRRHAYADVIDVMRETVREAGMILIPQPAETHAVNWGTLPEYSVGSTRLDIGDDISGDVHPEGDKSHMNTAFGRLALNAIVSALDSQRSSVREPAPHGS